MTAPMPETMSPREKVAALKTNDPTNPAHRLASDLQAGHFAFGEARDDLIEVLSNLPRYAALASSGDHAELARIEETVIENLRARGMRSVDTPAIQDVFDALDEWKGIADREFAARTAAREEATKYKRLLGDLLCIIHRDGGHRIEEVGIEAASNEATSLSAALIAETAALREKVKFEIKLSVDNYVRATARATEAERKLAEAVGLMKKWQELAATEGVQTNNNGLALSFIFGVQRAIRTFLSSKEAERG